jgi:serine/threonine protein kinase
MARLPHHDCMTDAGSNTQHASEADHAALRAGQQVGRYEILSILGQGGFGITYRARDSELGREVAIKEYLPSALAVRQDGITVLPRTTKMAEDFTWGRDRFVAEGRTLASLHHAPAIVRVFDFLQANGTAYIVMELLSGETLEGRIRSKGPLGAEEIEKILWPLLDGLEQVHNAGFLHRDIKPANILLNARGTPTLIDFGASRAAMAGRTTAMTAIFTPGYAAAEQMTSAKQGPWTDIYGLSATLYHAITGQAPPSAFDRMLDDEYRPLAKKAPPGFGRGLLAGLDAGLAVRASDRPQSVAGWRGILAMKASATDDATQLAAPPAEPAATAVAPREPAPAPPPAPAPAPPPAAPAMTAAPPPARTRVGLYAGAAAVALLLLGGGGYVVLSPRSAPPATTTAAANLQDLKVEDLERVLAERRKAEAEAAEKRRLEEEAKRQAEADAASKQAADVNLVKAEEARRKAEEELARLKAEIAARRQDQENEARRAEAEAAQRKAEAEMAALRQAEDNARRKAAADAEAKRLADEALARAQVERRKADEEARLKAAAETREKAEATTKQIAEAEARQKAEAEARQKADAEARQKAEAETAALADRKAAEAAETALRLSQPDRQRLQVALTSLGFDTRGTDGTFGPRSRDMIAAWQKSKNQPATGFVTAPQNQALLRDAAPALNKYDEEQKKTEEEKKKAEEARKKADDEAKAKAAAAAAPAPGSPSAASSTPPTGAGAFDGNYGGTLMAFLYGGGSNVRPTSIRVTNGVGNGAYANPRCGSGSISLRVSPAGEVSGEGVGFDSNCGKVPLSARGRIANGQLQLLLDGPGGAGGKGTLTLGAAAPTVALPSEPPPAAAAAAPATPGASPADVGYKGTITMGGGNSSFRIPMTVRVANGTGTGTTYNQNCGQGPISIRVSPAGEVSGEATGFDGSCGKRAYGIRGRLAGNELQLNLSAPGIGGTGTLTRQ